MTVPVIERPQVGVGVMIFKDGKVLLGKRKGSHGEGEYSFPGGHHEYMESFEACAMRETAEECGIAIKNVRVHLLVNVTAYRPKHYVHVGVIADWDQGEPVNLEPEKLERWDWFDLEKLPEPIFKMAKAQIDAYRSGVPYLPTIA